MFRVRMLPRQLMEEGKIKEAQGTGKGAVIIIKHLGIVPETKLD